MVAEGGAAGKSLPRRRGRAEGGAGVGRGRVALAGLHVSEPTEDEVGGAETECRVEREEVAGEFPAGGGAEGAPYLLRGLAEPLDERGRRLVTVARTPPGELVEPHPAFVFDRAGDDDDEVRRLCILDDRGHATAERGRQVAVARHEEERGAAHVRGHVGLAVRRRGPGRHLAFGDAERADDGVYAVGEPAAVFEQRDGEPRRAERLLYDLVSHGRRALAALRAAYRHGRE